MSSDLNANSGSRARDHLANERTFLAWVRTAFGTLALGIAVERFGADGGSGASIVFATVLIVASVGLLVLATVRYFKVARELDEGLFHVDRRSPWVILVGAAVLALLAIALFLV